MSEIPFMAFDPETECLDEHSKTTPGLNCISAVDENPQETLEIADHINSYSATLECQPGAEVFEICEETVNPHKKVNAEDFRILSVIGKGGYGTVFLVQKVTKSFDKDKFYAMKVLKKAKLICNEKNTVHTVSERNILQMLKHPFLVRLHYAFQNRSNLFIVLEYCPGGELFRYLEKECFLSEEDACFYTSEIALAIGHLHSLGIIYRDLKPENILLDKVGHIKLTDFGLSKEGAGTTNTFCGTIEYMAPEILRREGHGKAVDWWSLGTLLFDILSGGPPFSQESNKKATAEKILKRNVKFPPSFSAEAVELIRGLLKKDPKERIGSKNDVEEIKQQTFFTRHNINWDDVYSRRMEPPFTPELASDSDVSMFDPTFTDLKPIVSPGNVDEPIPIDLFQGFSYVQSSVCENSRALIPDLSRLRSSQRGRPTRGLNASPMTGLTPGCVAFPAKSGLPLKSDLLGLNTSPCGVDLRDFANPLRPTQAQNGVQLDGVCTSTGATDDSPGTKAISIGASSRAPHTGPAPTQLSTTQSSSDHLAPLPSQQHFPKTSLRTLGDTKPSSYPNLLITKGGQQFATSHPSTDGVSVVDPSGGPVSVTTGGTSSGAAAGGVGKKAHHNAPQAPQGSNGKDPKCAVM